MTDFADRATKTHVAYICETWGQSAARDLTTVACFVGLWSLGYFVGSAALEWVGVLLGGLVLFARILSVFKRSVDTRMTPAQARAWLDKHFPEATQ